MYTYKSRVDSSTIYIDIIFNGILIGTKEFYLNFTTSSDNKNYTGVEAAMFSTKFEGDHFGFSFNSILYPIDSIISTPDTIDPNVTSSTSTANTANIISANTSDSGSTFNSPDVESIKNNREDLQNKITNLQSLGLPSIKDIPNDLWKNLIKPKLLTPRQVAKKMIMIQNPSIPEAKAQQFIYGKTYYKNGTLFDNDDIDPICVSQPTDEDYNPPINENHPLWKNTLKMISDSEHTLIQLGIKLGEFTLSLPSATATIAVSLTALVSSVAILPFGAGIPTALSAVQTMTSTIKELQSKTIQILPLLAIVDTIGLLLPKEAQAVIVQINVIFGLFLTIISILLAIIGLLDKIISKISKLKKKMDAIQVKIEVKATPSTIKEKESSTLSVNATGGSWEFSYEWTDFNGSIVERDPNETEDDEGTRIVTPTIFEVITFRNPTAQATYTCKVKDVNTNVVKTASVVIKRI